MRIQLAIVGAGPRGLSVLERICAFVRHRLPDVEADVHIVDPHPAGAGNVWRTTQSRHLLMNTVASQVTMFTDDTVDLEGPLCPGPSLYEWARFVTLIGTFDDHRYSQEVLAEVAALGPESYPSRPLYGRYLEWVFRHVWHNAPDRVRIHVHTTRAVALDDTQGATQILRLQDGTVLPDLDAVVLAQGHLPTVPSARENELVDFAADHGLRYVGPVNPANVVLHAVRPGERVGLLGLGLNFFDYMALFTVGRGGAFGHEESGELVYLPSGREPRLFAGSRRGVPYHSRGENQKGAHGRHIPSVLTIELIARLRAKGGLDFRRDIWPLVAKEVETVYYTTYLTAERGSRQAARFRVRYLAARWGSEGERHLLDKVGVPADQRWDWDRIARPYGSRTFSGPADFRSWLVEYLHQDVAEARAGNVDGPLKAALDVLRDLRNEVRLVVDHGGLTGTSHQRDLDHWYTPLNAYLSIGPPIRRIEEALALIRAGILEVIGPNTEAELDAAANTFVLRSLAVPGSDVPVTTLIDARLPDISLHRTADPLMSYLQARGRCRRYRVPDLDGGYYETDGLDVTERPYRIVEASGRVHPRRFAFGVPTESVHWITAAGIRPGVNSVTLTDSDAIAQAAITVALGETKGTLITSTGGAF